MRAHLFILNGKLAFSGYNASGDPSHRWAAVVETGRDILVNSNGKLVMTSNGPQQHREFTPVGVLLAARSGFFGFTLVDLAVEAAAAQDKENKRRQKLGRRGRIAEDQEKARCDVPENASLPSSPSTGPSPARTRKSATKKLPG